MSVLTQLSIYSAFLPLTLGLVLIVKGRMLVPFKLIFLLVCLSIFSDFLSVYLAREFGNNMPWFHTWSIIESLILIFFFKIEIGKKRLILFTGTGLIAFLIINSVILGDIYRFNTIGRSVVALVIILYCIFYYHNLFQSQKEIFIERSGTFWVVSGILIYFSGSFFSFMLYEKIMIVDKSSVWVYHNIANFLKNILFSIGFLLASFKNAYRYIK